MKNLLWALLLLMLIAAGAVAGYVVVYPAKSVEMGKSLLSGKSPYSAPKRVAKPAGDAAKPAAGGGKQVAAAPGAKKSGPPPAKSSGPPPAAGKKPPSRGTKVAKMPAAIPAKRAKFLGMMREPPNTPPPPPELFAFRVDKRTKLNADTIQLELSIQNLSGKFWKDAYLVLKSTDFPDAAEFQVSDWMIDEVRGIDYQFPSAQLAQRVRNLRIARVSGETMDSALAEELSERRERLVESIAPKPKGGAAAKATPAPTKTPDPRLHLETSNTHILPKEVPAALDAKDEQGHAAFELLKNAHLSALRAEENLNQFVEILNDKGYEDGMAGGGANLLTAFRKQRDEFSDEGVQVEVALNALKNEAVAKPMRDQLHAYATGLLGQMEFLQKQVRARDPQFSFFEAAKKKKK